MQEVLEGGQDDARRHQQGARKRRIGMVVRRQHSRVAENEKVINALELLLNNGGDERKNELRKTSLTDSNRYGKTVLTSSATSTPPRKAWKR